MMWWWLYLSSLIGALCTVFALTVMRRREKSNIGMLGWLALVVLTPPIGLLLFLLFGGKKISSEHQQRRRVQMPRDEKVEIEPNNEISRLAMLRGLSPPTFGNHVKLLDDPVESFETLVELTQRANHSLCIAAYILEDDKVMHQWIPMLQEKARNGVEVLLLMDGLGCFNVDDALVKPLRDAGGKTAVFKPMSRLSRFAYVNYRNHRKMFIADGKHAMVGGANFVEIEMTPTPNDQTWVDLNVKLEGPAASQVQAIFDSDWEFVTGEHRKTEISATAPARALVGATSNKVDRVVSGSPSNGGQCATQQDTAYEVESPGERGESHSPIASSEVQVLPLGADSQPDLMDDVLLEAIHQARERLWIATPFFIPPPAVMRSLELACRRQVDLQLVYPDQTSVRAADYARYDYVGDLQEHKATVWRLPDVMMHAKTILVDDSVAMVGSANFDMRSFFLNYEMLLLFQDRQTIAEVERWFRNLMNRCERGENVASPVKRFLSHSARLVATEL